MGGTILLPGKLAIEATAANRVVIEQMKASAVRKTAKERAEAEQEATKLSAVELTFERKVGENEQLFGSVTSGDIAHMRSSSRATRSIGGRLRSRIRSRRSASTTCR